MYRNKRPTANCLMLNNYSKRLTPSNKYVCNDYLLKHSGELRDNVYCIDPLRLHKLNILGKRIYRIYGNREGVYYSGNYEQNEMFYNKQYTNFKSRILQEAISHKYFVKIDLKNFYKSIDINTNKNTYLMKKFITF